jgi:hypothetical protein
METQPSLLEALAPSLVAGLALISAAVLTYLLTTRLEHRKWLRQERLQAYEGYLSCLREIERMCKEPDKGKIYPKELVNELLGQTERLLLFSSKEVDELVEEHGKLFQERSVSDLGDVLPGVIVKFRKQARRDLGADKRTH